VGTPTVGVSHDVVIYDGTGNLPPVGLIVRPMTYRVGEAPNFIPRMAAGDPRGTDTDQWTTWVQTDWRGGVRRNYRVMGNEECMWAAMMRGMIADRTSGKLKPVVAPVQVSLYNPHDPTDVFESGSPYYLHRIPPNARYLSEVPFAAWNTDDPCCLLVVGRYLYFLEWVDNSPEKGEFARFKRLDSAVTGLSYPPIDAVVYSGIPHFTEYEYVSAAHWYTAKPMQVFLGVNTLTHNLHYCTTGGALAVYDGKLWRSEFLGGRIAYYDPNAGPVCVSSGDNTCYAYGPPGWSDWYETGPNVIIRRMVPFIGRLMIGACDGLWAFEAGRTYKVVDFSDQFCAYNFQFMVTTQGALWFNIRDRIYRYTTGGLLQEVDWTPQYARWTINRCLYEWVGSGTANGLLVAAYPELWYIDGQTLATTMLFDSRDMGLSLHPLFAVGLMGWPAYRDSYLFDTDTGGKFGHWVVGPVEYSQAGNTGRSCFWLGDPTRLPYAGVSEHAWNWSNPDWHYVELCPVALGYPALKKRWLEVAVTHDFNGQARIKVWTRADESESWNYAGELTHTNGRGTLELDVPDSEWLQVKLGLVCVSTFVNMQDAGISAVEIRGAYRPSGRKQIHFNAIVVDDLQLLDMTVENSAAWVTSALYSLAGSGAIHTVALPYPPPVGHTIKAMVEIGPVGAAVPILSYDAPSGCPGSDISVVITEV